MGAMTDNDMVVHLYCAGNVLHGITNTGQVPMTFYWSKWMART